MKNLSAWKLVAQKDEVIPEQFVLPVEVQTLDEASRRLPGGAYSTFRTYTCCKVLHFRDHVDRLEQTAELAGQPHRVDERGIRTAIRGLLDLKYFGQDVRLRLLIDLESNPGDMYIILEPLVVPSPRDYREGVKVVTCNLSASFPKQSLRNASIKPHRFAILYLQR